MPEQPGAPMARLRRRCWRMLAPRWAHEPLSGAGAASRGGRFNPAGVAALYMSEEFSTAVGEYEQELGFRPGTLCAYDIESERVVDLGDARARGALRVDQDMLLSPWKRFAFVERRTPPTWALAEQLIAMGAEGVRVPSAIAAGFNLVFWRWNDGGSTRIAALDPLRDLPSDQSSWKVQGVPGHGAWPAPTPRLE